jgi:hypothetical protein
LRLGAGRYSFFPEAISISGTNEFALSINNPEVNIVWKYLDIIALKIYKTIIRAVNDRWSDQNEE